MISVSTALRAVYRTDRARRTDQERVAALLQYTAAHGLGRGFDKAVADADRIESVEKAAVRGALLAEAGMIALARPFVSRAEWLLAQHKEGTPCLTR